MQSRPASQTTTRDLPASGAAPERRYELDWLRVLVVLGLIPYHAAVIFALGPADYIHNAQSSVVFDAFATLLGYFGMPLLFLISGASMWYALKRRGPIEYAWERVRRLAIPFVFAVLIIVPVQVYFGNLALPGYTRNYLQFYHEFLNDWAHVAQTFAVLRGVRLWGHLWFIPLLLALSIVMLPLFELLRGPWHGALVWLGQRCERRGGILLLGVVPGLIQLGLRGHIGPHAPINYNFQNDAAGFVMFGGMFVLGYVLYSDKSFQRAVLRWRWLALVELVVIGTIFEAGLVIGGDAIDVNPWAAPLVRFFRGYLTWCWMIGLLGLGVLWFSHTGRVLRYLNEAFYPLYVLHMPILVIGAYFIVPQPLSIWTKYGLLIGGTAVGTFAVYDLLVRRIAVLRFLFGMKARLMPDGRPASEAKQHVPAESSVRSK